MTRKAVIFFAIWTSVWCAVFNLAYEFLPYKIGWIMFIVLAIFFGLNLGPKDAPSLSLSAICGLIWGQVDFLLISLFCGILGLNAQLGGFLAVVLGTAVTMILHIHYLAKTPFRHVPIIFAGVALTFSQGGQNIVGLLVTLIIGVVLAGICGYGLQLAADKFNT